MGNARRILIMVPNGASNDNRVVREAESLKLAGYEVLLAGLRLRNLPGETAMTPRGVAVVRLDWRRAAYARIAIAYSVVFIPLVFALGIAAWYVYQAAAIGVLREHSPLLHHALVLAFLGGIALLLLALARGVIRKAVFPDGRPRGLPHDGIRQHFIMQSRTRAFIRLGMRFKPDIIQCHEIGTLQAAIELKQKLGCKVIYEAHEIYDDLANATMRRLRLNRKIHRRYLPAVDGFITVNEDIGDYYKASYPSLPTPVILPNSVYPRQAIYDGRLHDAANLSADVKIILYQGKFSPNRGLPLLLEAAFSLPDGWNVVFMGDGPLEETLTKSAEKHQRQLFDTARTKFARPPSAGTGPSEEGPADARDIEKQERAGAFSKVRFVPIAPHSELVEWTAGATIGVIPYENVGLNHWFCSPNKIWEYPNAGVPILASRLHYLSRVIDEWKIGWTFAAEPTVSEIVAAIRSITEDDLAQKRANCARFIAAENYPIHEKRLLALIEAM
jgi:glycosyltransferase involved in cell wall biosynthesis